MHQHLVESEPSTTPFRRENRAQTQASALLPPARTSRVRRRRYTLRKAQVFLLQMGANGCLFVALLLLTWTLTFSGLAAGVGMWEHFFPTYDSRSNLPVWECARNIGLFLAPFAAGACVLYKVGRGAKKKAVLLKDAPLLPAQTGSLLAADVLVRPSAQPLQEQQSVLLRAVTSGQQTSVEQLVRPAGGQESR